MDLLGTVQINDFEKLVTVALQRVLRGFREPTALNNTV